MKVAHIKMGEGGTEFALLKEEIAIIAKPEDSFTIAKKGTQEYTDAKKTIEDFGIVEQESPTADEILRMIKQLPNGIVASTQDKAAIRTFMFCLATPAI